MELKETKQIVYVLFAFVITVNGQQHPPGVAPQHYQQYQQVPVHQQQYQQHPQQQQQFQQPPVQHGAPGVAPQHFQQQPQVQYQQVPVQQQQQQQQQYQQQPQMAQHQPQVQQHQIPQQGQAQPHAGHHQPHGQHPQQVLNAANMQHERAHIQEHIQVPIDTSKMSEAELQFHYFKMHDSDNNNKLDGCELIKSLIHWHAHEDKEKKEKQPEPGKESENSNNGNVYTDERLAEIIDYVLKTMDFNNDGFVDYAEYRKSDAESKAEEAAAKNKN